MTHRLAQRLLSLVLCAGVAAPTQVFAAPARRSQQQAAPATDGRTVAVLRFAGEGEELRSDIARVLEEQGFTVKTVALSLEDAAKQVKCGRKEPTSPDCLGAIGTWLNSKPRTAADFIVYGQVDPGPPRRAELVTYDIAKQAEAVQLNSLLLEQDFIAPIAIPQELASSLEQHIEPIAGPTQEEQELLAELDEPEKTAEEIAAERRALEEAERQAAVAQQDAVIDTSEIPVNLRTDFKDFCRNERRRKRESKDDPRDLRPSCKLGPFWGYWQPRSWVTMGLAIGTGVATIAFYSLALVARKDYADARDRLDNYLDEVDGDPRRNPSATVSGGQRYDELATEVSRTGSIMRRRAIVGDILLGTTALVTGVLGIMIWQDRNDAKSYIRQEKGLRAISDLRVGPMLTRDAKGMGLGFRF